MKEAYYAVIFTSIQTGEDIDGYNAMGERIDALAKEQDGYLGMDNARDSRTGLGITISYWRDMEAIRAWRGNAEHEVAQRLGKEVWYQSYRLRVSKVVRDYSFEKDSNDVTAEM